jgi:hypothetical protein
VVAGGIYNGWLKLKSRVLRMHYTPFICISTGFLGNGSCVDHPFSSL